MLEKNQVFSTFLKNTYGQYQFKKVAGKAQVFESKRRYESLKQYPPPPPPPPPPLLKGKCHEMKGQKNLRFYLQLLTFVQTDLLFLSILLINIFFFVLLIFGRIGYCTLQEITLVCSFMFIYVRHTITGYKTGYHWSTTLEQLTFSPYSAFFREQCWRQCTTKVRTTICF